MGRKMRGKRCSDSTLWVMLKAIADLGLGFGADVLRDLGEICRKRGRKEKIPDGKEGGKI